MTADPHERLLTCYHEVGHAVFAYHDDIVIDEVWVSDESGGCVIWSADLYERYQTWEYARCCLAGAYARYIAETLVHPKPEEMSLDRLRERADELPEGDAWWVVNALEDNVARDECPFESVEDAYSTLWEELGELVEERWN